MTIVSSEERDMPPMPTDREARLKLLDEMPDSEIDFSDIPKVTDFSGFMTVEEVKAYKAARKALPLDADVFVWVRRLPDPNAVLREAMIRERQEAVQ
ncbi:MAG: hypothetical protein FWF98_05085 [Dehalococcoidia bacterium]|nr:hypothetical protein [Dehalococcoidia bacterium]